MHTIKRTTAVAAGAGLMLLAGTGTAFANHTNVTVGGSDSPAGPVDVTGTNTSTISFETNFGVELNCDSSDITGNVLRGASVAVGTKVGEITNLEFTDCTATSLDLPVVVTMSAGDFVVSGHPANAGDPVPVTIDNVAAHVYSTGSQPWACEMYADGSVDATINPGSTSGPDGEVSLASSGDDLDITTGDGFGNRQTTPGSPSCGGQVETGDLAGPLGGDFDLDTDGEGAISHG
ncbi:hypothetical protein ACHAAC_08075 [Aeromicrobium sp. CF4.19]|uniref:hypothetical protein n=1 Tax=Aeromicrobium sp. CF4.19 TaxID=3373082 RepID=UPI003EE7ACAB